MKRIKTVSLCMIVKNEGKFLERCLNSVKDLVDEMIIIDTGSTDNTVEIAKKFNARVELYKWDNSFSNAKNFAIEKATKDWILLMDGDDEFKREDYNRFIQIVNHSISDGHFFNTLSFTGDEPGKDIVSNLNLRLLRNSKKYKFTGSIHEQISLVGGYIDYNNFGTEDISVYHYGYLTGVSEEKNKRNRNMSLIEKELEKDPNNPFHQFNLGNEYFALADSKKALECFDEAYSKFDIKSGFSSKLVIRRIMCMQELNRYNDALKAIEEGLKHYPKFTDLEFIRGCIYLDMQRITLAISSFNRCIQMGSAPLQLEFLNDCGTFRPYQALGDIYFKYEDYYNALEAFKNALRNNSEVHKVIYKIGTVLNKIYEDKRLVAYNLSQFFNIEYVPNLILIADVLISEGLYDLALGYIEKAEELEVGGNNQLVFLKGRDKFYKKDYEEASSILNKIPRDSEEYKAGLKYSFLVALITKASTMEGILNSIEERYSNLESRVFCQLHDSYLCNEKNYLNEKDDSEVVLKAIMEIIVELLKVKEFEVFEKALNVLNFVESKRVLLHLANLYFDNGFKGMAVSEVIRSIKELDCIDSAGIDILHNQFCKINL